jgi:hypothetical protein
LTEPCWAWLFYAGAVLLVSAGGGLQPGSAPSSPIHDSRGPSLAEKVSLRLEFHDRAGIVVTSIDLTKAADHDWGGSSSAPPAR